MGSLLLPRLKMDNILKKAAGDISIVERELGISPGGWKGQEVVRIDIPNPRGTDIRIPNGNESGANDLWIPGGKTSGGRLEAVVNPIKKGNYKEILTYLK